MFISPQVEDNREYENILFPFLGRCMGANGLNTVASKRQLVHVPASVLMCSCFLFRASASAQCLRLSGRFLFLGDMASN